MNRRDTILGLLALSAVAGPFGVRAQEPESARRVGVLMGYDENDPEAWLRLTAFKEALAVSGWAEGRNLTLDVRWTAGDVDRKDEPAPRVRKKPTNARGRRGAPPAHGPAIPRAARTARVGSVHRVRPSRRARQLVRTGVVVGWAAVAAEVAALLALTGSSLRDEGADSKDRLRQMAQMFQRR